MAATRTIENDTQATPIATRNQRHPKLGRNQDAISAPMTIPPGIPIVMMLIALPATRRGIHSPIIAVATGKAAPKPRPLTKRSSMNARGPPAPAQAIVTAPKKATLATSVGFRPKRSPVQLPISVPTAMPIEAAASRGANWSLPRPHNFISAGAE